MFERLEDRRLLALVNWVGGSGDWNVGANWSNGVGPQAGDDAVIDVTGITITHSAGAHAIKSLTLNNAMTLSGGQLTVAENLVVGNDQTLTLSGGTVNNATLVTMTGASIVATGSATNLDGVTLGGTVNGTPRSTTLNASTGFLGITGGLTLANGSAVRSGRISTLTGDQAIGGDGTFQFETFGQWTVSGTLTLESGLVVRRDTSGDSAITLNPNSKLINQTTIRAAGGTISFAGTGSVLNDPAGLIAADGGNVTINAPWSNAGQLTVVVGSTLNLGGMFTTSGIGSLTNTGGTVNITGTLNNAGSILVLNDTTGSWHLASGKIIGGHVVTSGSASLATALAGGTLEGVTLGGTLNGTPLPAALDARTGFITITGGLTMANGSVVRSGRITTFTGDQTFGGNGTFQFETFGQWSVSGTLTLDPGLVVRRATAGESSITLNANSQLINRATIGSSGGNVSIVGSGTFRNDPSGLVIADGGTVSINTGWSNQGQFTVTGSTLNLGSTFTTADIGSVMNAGGTVNITGTLNNAGSMLVLNDTTGTWHLSGGKIIGGQVVTTGNAALAATISGGTLEGVTLGGTLHGTPLPGAVDARTGFLTVTGGLTMVNGTLLRSGRVITLTGDQTVGGNGTFQFETFGQWSVSGTLTLDSGLVVRRATSGDSSITLNANSQLINRATIGASGGTVSIVGSGTFRNDPSGLVIADGGTVSINTGWSNHGQFSVDGSTLNLGSTFTTADIGSVTNTGGTVNITGTLNNAGSLLVLNDTTGSWHLAGKIIGGQVVTSGNAALVATIVGGTLEGVTLGGTLNGTPLPGTVDALTGFLTITGGLTILNGTVVRSGRITTFTGDQAFGGDGTFQFETLGQWIVSGTLTLDAGLVVRRATTGLSPITINPGSTLINRATLQSSVGTVSFVGNGALQNAVGGTLAADGGTFTLNTPWSNSGLLKVVDGTLNLGNTFTTAQIGSLSRLGGTINVTGVLDNTGSTLALDAATGTWRLADGQIRGGNLVTSEGAMLTWSVGTLDGLTLGGTLQGAPLTATLDLAFGNLDVRGGLQLQNGSVLPIVRNVTFTGDQTISGDGEIRFVILGAADVSAGHHLTFAPGVTIHRANAGNSRIAVPNGSTLTNRATIRGDQGGILRIEGPGQLINAAEGILEADGGTLSVHSTANYASGVLTGGTWRATGTGKLEITGADIIDNAATIVLDGATAKILKNATESAIAGLQINLAGGGLSLLNGASFNASPDFTNSGIVTLGAQSVLQADTLTQSDTGKLVVEIAGDPASGRYGRAQAGGTAALDGILEVRLVGGYGPNPGLIYPVLTFGTRSGAFDEIQGLEVGGTPIFSAQYENTQLTLTSLVIPADLAFVSATLPASMVLGQTTQVHYTIQNLTATPAAGSWFDSLYLSIDTILDPSDVLLGRVEHHGGIGGNASYQETLLTKVPPLPEGNYHLIVLADSRRVVSQIHRANDVGASSELTELTMPRIRLGESYAGTIQSGQEIYLRLDLPSGRDVRVTTDYAVPSAVDTVMRYGQPPDRSIYDNLPTSAHELSRTILLATPLAGRHYVLLRGLENAGAGQPFSVLAELVPFELSGFTPERGSNSGAAKLRISGSQFTPATSVELTNGQVTRTASQVDYMDANTLIATVDLQGLQPGDFEVRVTDSSHSAKAAGSFTVHAGTSGRLRAFISSPKFVRPGRIYPVTLVVSNEGDADLPAPLITIVGENGLLRFPGDAAFSAGIQVLGGAKEIIPSVLPAGYQGTVHLEFTPILRGRHYTLQLLVTESPSDAVNWDEFKASLKPENVSNEAWDAIFAGFVSKAGDTFGQYESMLRRNADYLAQIHDTNPLDVERLLAFELQKTNAGGPLGRTFGDPHVAPAILIPHLGADLGFYQRTFATEAYLGLSFAYDVAYPATGLDLFLNRAYPQTLAGQYALGLFGRGWAHSWDIRATIHNRGDVTIHTPAGERVFVRQKDGSFHGAAGDPAMLTMVGGVAPRLRMANGTVLAFYGNGKVDYVEDRNGNRITASYANDRLTMLEHSGGGSLAISYNAQGRISEVKRPDGRITAYAYDAVGEHLMSVTDEHGTVEYAYSLGQGAAREHALVSIQSFGNGPNTQFVYDDQGRVSERIVAGDQAAADRIQYQYLDSGAVRVIDATGRGSVVFSDNRGRLVKQFGPDPDFVRVTVFDQNRLRRKDTLPGILSTVTLVDQQSRIAVAVDATGGQIDLDFEDSSGAVAALTDARGNTLQFSQDARGNNVRVTHGDQSSTFEYDATGNQIHSKSAAGRSIRRTFDDRGLLVRNTYADDSHVDFSYDLHGNLVAATDANGTITMQYDSGDRMTRIAYPSGRFLNFSYDARGLRTSMSDHTGFTVRYQYDAAGRLVRMSNGNDAVVSTFEYDGAGRRVRQGNANGTSTTYAYDVAGRIKQVLHFAMDGSVSQLFDYKHDALGRRTGMSTLDGDFAYAYNAAGQLIRVDLPSGEAIEYQYDAAGNRISVADSSSTVAYTTNALNQYTAVGGTSLAYDADGNLVSRTDATGTTTYAYNADNRLVSISGPTGTWTFEYDALGSRTATVRDGVRTEYLIDPHGLGHVIAEFNAAGELDVHYLVATGPTSRIDADGLSAYYNFDALGSTSQITGPNGVVLNRYSYLPFGEVLTATESIANSFTFVAEYGVGDEGGQIYFMRERFYDPQLGRFIQRDPIGLDGRDANLYRYVDNNPTNETDPSGLISFDECFAMEGMWFQRKSGKNDCVVPTKAKKWCLANGGYFNPIAIAPGVGNCVLPIEPPSCDDENYDPESELPCIPPPEPPEPPPPPPEKTTVPCDAEGGTRFPTVSRRKVPKGIRKEAGSSGAIPLPCDPNEINGPAGYGEANYLMLPTPLDYTVYFENKDSATAPAQEVVITQQLDSDLDWTTFELGDVGFGTTIVDIPDGRRFYHTRVDVRSSMGLLVDFKAGIDLTSGLVTWTFQSLDPETLDLTADALAGFLPPNKTSPQGEGFVSYRVRVKANAASGTEVRSVATIAFDTNDPITTNQVDPNDPSKGTDPNREALVTLDAGRPTSRVAALPAVTRSLTFPVSWSGSDDPGGSGIATYDVFVSAAGGPFVLWQDDTTQTSADFTGQNDTVYAFYATATDNTGQTELSPATAQADTLVRARPWQNPSNPFNVNADPQNLVTPIDVLLVINELNRRTALNLPPQLPVPPVPPVAPPPFLDANGDNLLTPLDALVVINQINQQAGGEGESRVDRLMTTWPDTQPLRSSDRNARLAMTRMVVRAGASRQHDPAATGHPSKVPSLPRRLPARPAPDAWESAVDEALADGLS